MNNRLVRPDNWFEGDSRITVRDQIRPKESVVARRNSLDKVCILSLNEDRDVVAPRHRRVVRVNNRLEDAVPLRFGLDDDGNLVRPSGRVIGEGIWEARRVFKPRSDRHCEIRRKRRRINA